MLEVGQMLAIVKNTRQKTSLFQRNCLPAQLYMLTFACMNKSRTQFYYSIPVRHHLWLSKKLNATETSDHPRGCATEAQRTHENIWEEKYCSKTFQRGGCYNLDHNQWSRKIVFFFCKLITAAKNDL